jgi:acylaminoacyl-peptidase
LGYGQKWVEELLGRIGELDVGDVMASAKQLIRMGYGKDPKEGPGTQLYMGGSHGGFIGAHGKCLLDYHYLFEHGFSIISNDYLVCTVIGQFPTFFSAAVLRNPVINIGSMISTTDIPDWTTVECGIPYKSAALMTPELYSKLYAKSPVQYVDKVETPVLLRIGEIDQRVPPSQGKEYYHLLKAREEKGDGEPKVEMLLFPENGHPLDGVEAEKTGWDATLAWFKKHTHPK